MPHKLMYVSDVCFFYFETKGVKAWDDDFRFLGENSHAWKSLWKKSSRRVMSFWWKAACQTVGDYGCFLAWATARLYTKIWHQSRYQARPWGWHWSLSSSITVVSSSYWEDKRKRLLGVKRVSKIIRPAPCSNSVPVARWREDIPCALTTLWAEFPDRD